jgi:hypothetical protein
MSKFSYNKLYLVALGSGIHASHRVTADSGRPGNVSFSGMRADENGDPMGTLVLDDALWNEWWGKRKLLDHMKTARSAADWLVQRWPTIFYGCPFCNTRFSNADDHKAHIEEELSNILKMFDEVEE